MSYDVVQRWSNRDHPTFRTRNTAQNSSTSSRRSPPVDISIMGDGYLTFRDARDLVVLAGSRHACPQEAVGITTELTPQGDYGSALMGIAKDDLPRIPDHLGVRVSNPAHILAT